MRLLPSYSDTDRDRIAYAIANETAISSIECNALAVRIKGGRWYDVRPMLDAREFSGEAIDMHRCHITHAVEHGLVIQSASQPHLLRVKR